MPKYRVIYRQSQILTVEFECDSKEEARELFEDRIVQQSLLDQDIFKIHEVE